MNTDNRKEPKFRVGDYVSFRYGPKQVWAQIMEDRGPLGVRGRRLYRVRVGEASGEAVTFEVVEDDLTLAKPERTKVIDYLKQGGLLAILRSNLGGGPNQPRVWITFEPNGGLTHTFSADRGLIGATVPFFALNQDRIFTPRAAEVIEFLRSFGLDGKDAEDILQSVGRAP